MRKLNIELRPLSRFFKNNEGLMEHTFDSKNGFELIQWSDMVSSPDCWHGGYVKDGKYIPSRQEKDMPEDEIPKETCIVIAFIVRDDKEGSPDIDLIGDRILNLDKESQDIAMEFLRKGYDQLQEIMNNEEN